MLRFALAAVAALAAGPAAALSCAYMSAEDIYRAYDARPGRYVAVYGGFTRIEKVRHDRTRDRVIWRAAFSGQSATSRAFDRPFAAEVEIVQPLWTGIDGGGADPDALADWLPRERGIVYQEKAGNGYRATVDICMPLVDADPANVRPTLDCLAGRRCPGSD